MAFAEPAPVTMARRTGKQLLEQHFAPVGAEFGDMDDIALRRVFSMQDRELERLPPTERVRRVAGLTRINRMYYNYYHPRLEALRGDFESGKLQMLYDIRQMLRGITDYHDTDDITRRVRNISIHMRPVVDLTQNPGHFMSPHNGYIRLGPINLGHIMTPDGRYSLLEVMMHAMDCRIDERSGSLISDYDPTTSAMTYLYGLAPADLQRRLRRHLPLDDRQGAHDNFESRTGPFTRWLIFNADGDLLVYDRDFSEWVIQQVAHPVNYF